MSAAPASISTPAPKIGADYRALRRLIEARIERDLAFLDLMDGDPDLEPSLGAPERAPRDLHPMAGGGSDSCSSQLVWADGGASDHEADAGDEPEEPGSLIYDGDAEPDVRRVRQARLEMRGGARVAA